MPIDYAALKTELLLSTYNTLRNAGNDQGLADAMNATSGSISVTIDMDRDKFLLAIVPAIMKIQDLALLNPGKVATWDRLLYTIHAANTIEISKIQSLLDLGVSDGILTQAYRNTIGVRNGSRAEQLFGSGTVVAQSDVSFALRGQR